MKKEFLRFFTTGAAEQITIKQNSPTTLRHLHFENLTKYEDGLRIQDKFVKANLDYKRIQSKIHRAIQQISDGTYDSAEIKKAKELGAMPIMSSYELDMLHKILKDVKPTPMLLTFEFEPVYTGGLREQHNDNSSYNYKQAKYCQTTRGGQVTYHGPGQLVAYSILDLKDYLYKGKTLTPRCYVNHLEEAVINTLKNGRNYDDSTRFVFDIDAKRTENTGVWINDKLKIASLGIHVTRNVTSHGVAINVSTDLLYPNRFTMCGLPDTKTTSMKELGVDRATTRDVALSYSKEFAKLMGFDSVEHMNVAADTFEEIQNLTV